MSCNEDRNWDNDEKISSIEITKRIKNIEAESIDLKMY
jgi:hypothetical protein